MPNIARPATEQTLKDSRIGASGYPTDDYRLHRTDATGHTWHHSDNELFGMVKTGIPEIVPGYQTDMPKYERILSAGDIWAVLSFIESTWPVWFVSVNNA